MQLRSTMVKKQINKNQPNELKIESEILSGFGTLWNNLKLSIL